jgi:hypothetical protein
LNAFDNTGDSRATVLIFTAQRVGEPPRIYENTTPSLLSRMGTGGNNVPMIAMPQEPIAFDSNASGSFKVHADGKSPPVKIGSALGIPSPPAVAIPIQDGREIEKRQNGLGVGQEGAPSYTLDQTDAQAIAFTTEQTPKYNQDVALTLTKGSPTGGGQPQSVAQPVTACDGDTNMVVRRLTPIECERLMGWPDNHTLNRADGKTNSDSTRYKMCGNGVATPVARWIAEQLLPLLK